MEAAVGDESCGQLVERIAALCKQEGLKNKSEGHRDGAFNYTVFYHYDPSDLEAAPLLWLMGQRETFDDLDSDRRGELGCMSILAAQAKRGIKIASVFPRPWIVVPNRTRRILKSGALAGLKFDEVSLRGGTSPASAEPFWELRSSIVLPKMVNVVPDTFVQHENFLIRDPYGEPHYRQSELQPLGIFDIAFTREPPGGNRDPSLIISADAFR